MTREEAIKELEEDKALYMPDEWVECVDRDTPDGRLITALEMAIKALVQDPCEDAISREAVKDKYRESLVSNLKDDDRGIDLSKYAEQPYRAFCEFIDGIPSVTPKQKTGHWITTRTIMHDGEYYCDKCDCDSPNNKKWSHCPNCGAKMGEEEDGKR